MTTGRINQVTILDPDAEAPRHDSRRSGIYQAENRRSDPNHLPRQYTWHRRCKQSIQLPPLSCPRCGPRRSSTDVSASSKPATYAPQMEKTHASSRTQGADTRRGCPQKSGEYLASPAIHRPQTMPANRKKQDFSCSPQVQAQHRVLLQHIGANLPVQRV